MDYTKLRAQAMRSGEDEEAVTVNTRALIDKVLARYSGEHTTLRELIQNAADASANTVKIKFETLPSAQVPVANTTSQSEVLKHVLLHHTLRRLVVTNDGVAFGVNDWSRLKRIAEGNPDETKIGAFGVGFYSVFADCEEPFVSSGKEAMAFYWKGNSLFTRKLQIPEGSKETSFVLDYRNNTSPIPSLLPLCQFLATSLTFVALQNIELWLDDWKILSLQKKAAPSVEHPIPRDVETKTKEGLMKVHSLSRESIQMDARFMNVVGWKPSASTMVPKSSSFGENHYGHNMEAPSLRSFFSRLTSSSSHANLKTKALREEQAMQEMVLEDLTSPTTSNVFLSVATGTIRTSVSASFAAELERATKKPPPKTTKLAILTSSYDETSALNTPSKDAALAKSINIFASVLPGKNPGGRIFIGFPTHQTTGAGIHLSAPSVIPTVERESIDLNARWVRTWNIEMLRVAGIITRLAFTREMADLGSKLKHAAEVDGRGAKIHKDDIAKLLPEAQHILQTFTFSESTPSSQVSQIIEEAFWTTYKEPSIEIYSTRGVLPTTSVRLATEDFSGFVEGIPVIPAPLTDVKFVKKLVDFGLITEITVGDVKQELIAKALTKDQLVQFIGWAGRKAISGEISASTIQSLLANAIATVGETDDQGEIISLGSIKYYWNPSKIPPEMPAPPSTLAFELTRASTDNELQALGWETLEIVPWLRFLIESIGGKNGLTTDQDITWSPTFAGKVLAVVSKQWDSFSQSSKATVVGLLKPRTIVPTKFGMKIPTEAYFPNVKLFDDLPNLIGCPSVKEKFLAALGVRKTVELDAIFERLLNPSDVAAGNEKAASKWSHVDLIRYLASVREDIPADDLKKLKSTPICAAEAGAQGQESSQGTSKRYRISDLYEPKDPLRTLGLPIIQWSAKGGWRTGSIEAKFLSSLGLKPYPSVEELVGLMASDDLAVRGKAMTYFITSHGYNGYASANLGGISKAFLPVQGDEQRLVTPSQCFTNEKSALFGFNVLQRSLVPHANKFGVAENPPMTECVSRLIASPPKTHREAISIFSYLTSRLGEIGMNHSAKLGDALIVPVTSRRNSTPEKTPEGVRYIAPRMCFIGDSGNFRDIFDFVDFGQDANKFLLHCGSKHEPSKLQVASMLATEPARVLGIVQSPDKYLSLLRMLADALPDLKRDKALFKLMKTSTFLLATRQIAGKPTKENEKKGESEDLDEEYEDAGIKIWVLQPAARIVVVDDYTSYRLFNEALLCAPLEESLEKLYLALGASLISNLVQDDIRLGSVVGKQDITPKLRKRILERSKLLLHEFPLDNIRHDARWLEKNLNVQMVSGITLRRTLRGYAVAHTAKQTATLNHDQHKGWVLWITFNYDMYHISQALIAQLLSRPNNQATTLFEFLLTSDLQGLKRRGFNVDRILRAQAVDARIAEDERKRQLETEQRQIKEQEEQWKQSQIVTAVAREEQRKSGQVPMPGAFESESPEMSPVVPQQKKSRGIFSGLTRRLGIDGQEAQQQLQNFFTGNHATDEGHPTQPNGSAPPSYCDESSHGLKPEASAPGTQTEKVTSPHALHQNLLNAIKSSRSHDSTTLFSPPTTTTVKEQASYCDSSPAHNIAFAGETRSGMRIFVTRDLSIPAPSFLTTNINALQAFASILADVADIYSLPRKAMHVFYDEAGSTIAFNAQGSVFCNFRFFQQLHKGKLDGGTVEGRTEAVSWWWVVVAHELAHNLVSEHSAEHSYYTESFIAQYFHKMMARATSFAQNVPVNRIAPLPPSSGLGAGVSTPASLLD